MNRKRQVLICLVIFIVTIISCVIIGKVTVASFIDNTDLKKYLSNENVTVAYYEMGYDAVTNEGYLDNKKINCIDDLMVEDTFVAKVKISKNCVRKKYYECILSKVDVIECYTGDLKTGESINVFEPVDCGFNDVILCTDGYSMMQPNREYIVFLKQLRNTYFGNDKYVYAPNSTLYSKFEVNETNPKIFQVAELENPEQFLLYSDIKDEEIYLYDQKMYDKYIKLKKDVLDKYTKGW